MYVTMATQRLAANTETYIILVYLALRIQHEIVIVKIPLHGLYGLQMYAIFIAHDRYSRFFLS